MRKEIIETSGVERAPDGRTSFQMQIPVLFINWKVS
jgi:hypothetical protein